MNTAIIGHYERCGYWLYTYAVYSGVYQPMYRGLIEAKSVYESDPSKLTADKTYINDIYAKYTALSDEEKACIPVDYVTKLNEAYTMLQESESEE